MQETKRRKWAKYYDLPEIVEIRNKIIDTFNNKLTFLEESHQYFLGNVEYQCVSNVVKKWESFDREAQLDSCARKAEIYPDYKYYGMTRDEIAALWDKNSGDACEFGTETHAFGESMFYYMTGQDDKILPECKKKFEGGIPHPVSKHEEAIVKFWNDIPECIVPVLSETKIINDIGTPYAGTFDILFYYVNEKNRTKDGLVLFDYKTNKSLYSDFARDKSQMMKAPFNDLYDENLSHYYLQLGLYNWPLEQLGYKVVGRRLIWLKSNGEYEKVEVPYMVDRIKNALRI